MMFEQLEQVEAKYEELMHRMQDPAVLSDHIAYAKLNQEVTQLKPVVDTYREWRSTREAIEESLQLLREDDDPELQELAKEEVAELQAKLPELEQEMKLLMLPTDPMDEKNIVLEIRAGTGGDESSLFCGDLFNLYSRYASSRGWRVEMMSASEGTQGGFKEVIAMIKGQRVYSSLKWESGVHRVQRVPQTEAQGRIHTSACTVAILPEAEDVDIEINQNDLRIDTYRASGAGGQHVNRTDSAIRITHLPTQLVVTCQDEKSQHKNRDKAMKVLKSRLYDMERQRLHDERADSRRTQVGSGDRSERIRTYNFPQNRVTDHRIGLTLYKLDRVMAGELDEVVDALNAADQAEKLKDLESV